MFFNDLFIIFIIIQKILPDASIDVRDNINRTETEVDRVEIILLMNIQDNSDLILLSL